MDSYISLRVLALFLVAIMIKIELKQATHIRGDPYEKQATHMRKQATHRRKQATQKEKGKSGKCKMAEEDL